MRKLRILVLMHEDFVPPESIEGLSHKEYAPFKTEFDVVATLEELGHEVRPLGIGADLGVVRDAIREWKPHIAFNLLEEFDGVGVYESHMVAYLELMRVPYTGCNPQGLTLAHDKALSKKILSYHRIKVPDFAVFAMGRSARRPRRLGFPLFVKSTTEEGSIGISQASIVHDDKKLADRVEYIHHELGTDAIAEQYIQGRELYVAVLGNLRLQTLPIWELVFDKLPPGAPRIATAKVKWDLDYQKKTGVKTRAAKDLPDDLERRIVRLCKRIYRALNLSGYARVDLRLTSDSEVYVLEANPNPQLSYGEDFAESAHKAGIPYEALLQRILNLGLRYRAEWKA
ncbi:MAG: ATP-grasp domain-containing protein [Planctomycetes bacterium]|nr:ATP-grasp domain-containing protein [Planctomycetota bacterium]